MDWVHEHGPIWLELDRECFPGEEIVADYHWEKDSNIRE